MSRSDLRDNSNVHIVVREIMTVEGDNNATNFGPFRPCIPKINNTLIDNAEDLDIVMPMYNFLEYSGNYSMISGSLWNCHRSEINDDANENNPANNRINNNKTITNKSFEYKTKLIGSTSDDNNILDAEVVVPLTYLSNFWRSLDLPLINCEIELDLSWSKEYIISAIPIIPKITGGKDADPLVQEVPVIQTTAATFQINIAKSSAPFVT